jgi:synaptobrevin family protein YKT6
MIKNFFFLLLIFLSVNSSYLYAEDSIYVLKIYDYSNQKLQCLTTHSCINSFAWNFLTGNKKKVFDDISDVAAKEASQGVVKYHKDEFPSIDITIRLFTFRYNDYIGVLVADEYYDETKAQQFLINQVTQANLLGIKDTLKIKKYRSQFENNFQDVRNNNYKAPVDKVKQVQQEINETALIITEAIQKVIERGEKLDVLVDRSANLSEQAKQFYKSSKEMNSCCARWFPIVFNR